MAESVGRAMTKRVPVDLTKRGHERLIQLKLRRSGELGCIVSMGFVVEELIDRAFDLEYALMHRNEHADADSRISREILYVSQD